MIGELIDAQERAAAFAQIFDRQSENCVEQQQRADDQIGVTVRPRIVDVGIKWVVVQRQGRKQRVVASGQRAAPVMPEDAPYREVLESVAARPRPCPCLQIRDGVGGHLGPSSA